jgi:bifunctional DNA-binding transcriptional regulator/antitoxin component of YhaV-PrlF toxin-antitoxin module
MAIRARISRRRSIRVPDEVLEKLRLNPGDTIEFELRRPGVRLRKAILKLEDTFGSVEPLDPPMEIDEAIRLAKEDKVRRDRVRLRRQEDIANAETSLPIGY